MTRDVDIKVQLGRDSAQLLLEILGSDYSPLLSDPLAALLQSGILFEYVTSWLVQFELALDDSTLIESYRQMRARGNRYSEEHFYPDNPRSWMELSKC